MNWIKHHRHLLLLLLLIVLTSCSSATSSTPKHTPVVPTPTLPVPTLTPPAPTPTPSQTVGPVPTLPRSEIAPLPTNCPLTALPGTKVFPKGWGGFLSDTTLIGRSPVWAEMGLQVQVYTGTQDSHVNWTGTKIIWEVGQDQDVTPLTVRVKNLATGALAWWGQGDQPPSDPVLALYGSNGGNHGSPVSGWSEWGSFLYLLTAGCYSMDVTWLGGGWHIVFVAGR